VSFDESEALTLEVFVGAWLAIPPIQFGFVIEKFQLRWPARHVQKDDLLGTRQISSRLRDHCRCRARWRSESVVPRKRRQRNSTQPHRALVQKVPSSDGF
jgi:hypothetical protein